MNSAYRRIELPGHVGEIGKERGAAADQHVIMAGTERRGRRKPHHFAQPPAHPVALHGIADLARHGEADPDWAVFWAAFWAALPAILSATPRLQDEGAGGRSCAFRGSLKVRAAL